MPLLRKKVLALLKCLQPKIHNRRIGEKGVRRLILNVYRYRLVMLFLAYDPHNMNTRFHVLHLIFDDCVGEGFPSYITV